MRVRATKGIEYLSRLLAEPGQGHLPMDLMELASEANTAEPDARGAELLDPQARRDYRRRLEELGEQLAEAETARDAGRLRAIQEEMASWNRACQRHRVSEGAVVTPRVRPRRRAAPSTIASALP
ncbi:MAG: hypothetical protein CL910_11795 [Deltaproteobacteria bacterium]|nr:hypothetical protein [Deltaproteobacteria bacterium]